MARKDEAEIITEEELKKALTQVFKRVQTDKDFRKLVKENPGEGIFKITGKRLPEGANLSFTEPD
jgi:hypothetical protein